MKFIVPLALALFALNVQAEEPATPTTDICSKYWQCGTYQGKSTAPDGKPVTVTITTRSLGPNLAEFIFHQDSGTKSLLNVKLTTHFQGDGSFTMYFDGAQSAFVAGMCAENACSFTMSTSLAKDDTSTIVGTFSFLPGNRMKFMMMALPVEDKVNTTSKFILKKLSI